jgi:SAM-dependent methyltransferase
MGFDVAAESYDRFMGRYSTPLGPVFADFAGVEAGERAVDVGAGPGALTAELVRRLGATNVAAVDPSTTFVDALRARHPDVDAHQGGAERLPFDDGVFDRALAQLVVQFMADPVGGLREMARVTKPGSGVVAACVWDFDEGGSPLSLFWRACQDLDPGCKGEAGGAGTERGQLADLFTEAGLTDVEEHAISVEVAHPTFEDWWAPYRLGVGPPGAYLAGFDEDHARAVEDRCRQLLPPAPFTITATAWAARGRAPA